MSSVSDKAEYTGLEIAVIGVACQLPGANSKDKFWENLINGKESVKFFSDEELLNKGVPSADLNNPNYIKAAGVIENIEYFDGSFFRYTHLECELMDPQIRLFHEYTWKALEDAGYDPFEYKGKIGLIGGASANNYWQNLCIIAGLRRELGEWSAMQLNDKDYLCTRISYKLNLRGPSITVHTACSTSLVAIHMACQSLLNYECDICLAGGVSISFAATPELGEHLYLMAQEKGYFYEEGMINSADGHCRAFDSKASGTVGGSGVGVVTLKRLDEAIKDKDNIYAIIKGTAINNDGVGKVGYTAPSIDGQADVVKAAFQLADVAPESVTYVEAHGTGTQLGDPIEVEALKLAFNINDKNSYCGLGSVKTNIGHLDTAAGVAGFIKTVLALKNKQIPPSLHFETPNPKIDFKNSPFYVNDKLKEWENTEFPLRAGVSSFGIGGTNAHAILEEAPEIESYEEAKVWKILQWSAESQNSLDLFTKELKDYLKGNREVNLSDVAYTLQVGRKHFNKRRFIVCENTEQAIEQLGSNRFIESIKKENIRMVFMFTGQGSQYINMAKGLYETETLFKKELDSCFDIVNKLFHINLKSIVYPIENNSHQINETAYTQPLLFCIEYSLTRLLMDWGIKPYAMIGHSLGEYVAACIAGVFSLEDALKLVVIRGKLMQSVPPGDMLSVVAEEHNIKSFINENVEIAAINTSSMLVLSGPKQAISETEKELAQAGISCTHLHTSHAFHSKMMEPVLKEFEEQVSQITLSAPTIPYISNISGTWISVEEATSPAYWANHIRQPVNFKKGLDALSDASPKIFLEIGPGKVLTTFVELNKSKADIHITLNSIRHFKEPLDDGQLLAETIGRMWALGYNIDWQKYYYKEDRRRVSLPTYCFDRKYHFQVFDKIKLSLQNKTSANPKSLKREEISNWFYSPTWFKSIDLLSNHKKVNHNKWLVFEDQKGMLESTINALEESKYDVIRVKSGNDYKETGDKTFEINLGNKENYEQLFVKLKESGQLPDLILHLTNFSEGQLNTIDFTTVENEIELNYNSFIYIAQIVGSIKGSGNIKIIAVADNVFNVVGNETVMPEKSMSIGPIKVIPQEYTNIKCKLIDINYNQLNNDKNLLYKILKNELNDEEQIVAYRNNSRWLPDFQSLKLDDNNEKNLKLKNGGTYLITGGTGGIGLELAKYISSQVKANIVLLSRSGMPEKNEWENIIDDNSIDEGLRYKLKKIKEIEKESSNLMVAKCDISDFNNVSGIFDEINKSYGKITGIIHSAGLADYEGIIQLRGKEGTGKLFLPKVQGTLILDKLIDDGGLDFFIMCSSLSSILAPAGEVGYVSANAFLDAFSHYKRKTSKKTIYTSINWGGMAGRGHGSRNAEEIK